MDIITQRVISGYSVFTQQKSRVCHRLHEGKLKENRDISSINQKEHEVTVTGVVQVNVVRLCLRTAATSTPTVHHPDGI